MFGLLLDVVGELRGVVLPVGLYALADEVGRAGMDVDGLVALLGRWQDDVGAEAGVPAPARDPVAVSSAATSGTSLASSLAPFVLRVAVARGRLAHFSLLRRPPW